MTCKSPSSPLQRSLDKRVNRKQRSREKKRESYLSPTQRSPPPPQNGFTKRQVTTLADSVVLRWCKSSSIKHGNITTDQRAHPAAPGLMEQRGWQMCQYPSMAAIWCGAATSSSERLLLFVNTLRTYFSESAALLPPVSQKTVFAFLMAPLISPQNHLSRFSSTTLNVRRRSLRLLSIISMFAVDADGLMIIQRPLRWNAGVDAFDYFL